MRSLGIFGLLFLLASTSVADAEEVRIKKAGLTLNAQLNIADGKALKDGAVLLVHGTLAHNAMDTIKNLGEVLNERGFNTLAINLSLGIDDRHGMYDCKVPHHHKHTDALDEITTWLEWLKAKGAEDVILLGHSRGGNQVTRFALARDVSSVGRVVLLAPSKGNAGSAESFKKLHGRPLQDVVATAEALTGAGKGSDMLKGVGALYCPGADVAAASFISYHKADPRFDTVTMLKDAKVPVLVIAGGKDQVVKGLPGLVGPLADGKKLHFSVVEDADHFFLDLFAEDVADLMEAFLSPDS